jgi:hypothetical protein
MQMRPHGGVFAFKQVLCSVLLALVIYSVHFENIERPVLAQGASGLPMLRSSDPAVRSSAAQALLANWQGSLKDLIEAVNGFDGTLIDTGLSKDDLDYFTRVTDVLRSIVVNDRGAIKMFREIDTDQTSRPLIWAARSSHRDLRVNATFILANVADNTNVCIVLNHLRQTDISADGIVNLLQIVIAVSSYIYKENYINAKQTLAELRKNLATRNEDFSRTYGFIDNLSKRLETSINKDESLPRDLSFCNSEQAKKL